MNNEWSYGSEVLKLIFPLLDGSDLLNCMLVSHQWKDIATDDYLWKCICIQKWPSVSKRSFSPTLTYHQHFVNFSKKQLQKPLLPPRLSLEDLEFYIDLWYGQNLIFSDAVSGPILQDGIPNPPPGIYEVLRNHLVPTPNGNCDSNYKLMMPIHPKLSLSLSMAVTVSVLVGRKDTNKMACIIDRSQFEYIDGSAYRAMAFDYMRFSPLYPFLPGMRAWVSLLFMENDPTAIDVFGIEMDFSDVAQSKIEVLWLLDMLDWK